MAQLQIVYWRDIPAQVIAKAGRKNVAKKELPIRFTEAIDKAAMNAGLAESDDYLGEWRRSEPMECSDNLQEEVDKHTKKIEDEFDNERLGDIVRNKGFEQ